MPRKSSVVNADVVAVNEIYNVAQSQANQQLQELQESIAVIKEESQAIGAITAIDANIAYNELLKAITLQRIKQNREYKKGGMTWDEFCDSLNLARRSVDLMLEDIRPVIDTFSAKFAGFCGMPFSKIRLLGRTISANLAENTDNAISYDGEIIPLTPENADDIQAIIERILEEQDLIKKELAAQDKAHKRSQDGTYKELLKAQKELDKFTSAAAAKGLTPDEDAFLKQIEAFRYTFDGFINRFNPAEVFGAYDTVTPRMQAGLISSLHYMKMGILSCYDIAVTTHGNPVMNPELLADYERWEEANGFK